MRAPLPFLHGYVPDQDARKSPFAKRWLDLDPRNGALVVAQDDHLSIVG